MRKLYFYIVVGLLLWTPIESYAQNSYFLNQRNLISLHVSLNPRLIPMSKDNTQTNSMLGENTLEGIWPGSFYQRYNDDNELVGGNEKMNIMLNASYAFIFGKRSLLGVEFNYQKHYLTMNEASTEPSQEGLPILVSTPLFNVYDLQLFYGFFSSGTIAPNKHLFTFGAGARIFSLDQDHNYRKDAETPYTNLANYMEGYDESFVYFKTSINYTYRILLTKNLSFDIGVNANIGLSLNMDSGEGYFQYHVNGPYYDRSFVKNKLGAETMLNILYFRAGLSLAI